MKELKAPVRNERIAVVLFNLGGPDSPQAVYPFLYNLFNDRAIIDLPQPFRSPLAWWIARQRTPKAQKIYAHLGGKSPLLENTRNQASALEAVLRENYPQVEWQVFTSMRYWHPMVDQVAQEVQNFNPSQVILLPLYPQFSTSTTASSLKSWQDECKNRKFDAPTKAIGCYPTQKGFIEAVQDLLSKDLHQAISPIRVLFSAHGLPQKVVDQGDPYEIQVQKSVSEVMKAFPDVDHSVCYQSKVGKLKWLEPSLDHEMNRASKDGVGVIVVPISFVSEHSETLVELDIDFANMAKELRLPFYARTPSVSCHQSFIQGLADSVIHQVTSLQDSSRICPANSQKCWCRRHG